MGDSKKMKNFNVLLITQEDPFYVRVFFESFLKKYSDLGEIKGVVIAPTMGKKSRKKLMRQMYDFYGPVNFLRMGFKYVWYKACDRFSHGLRFKNFYSIAHVCRHYKVPVWSCGNVNSKEFISRISKLDLDLIISVAAPQIFKEKIIGLPRFGCINIHNSNLPKYRGMLPNFWQMYNGEKAVGTTIHKINAGIDDGEILLQRQTPVGSAETLHSLIIKTKRQGAEFMIEVIESIKNGTARPLPNPEEEATYFTFPTREDVKEFHRKGYRII